MMSFERKGRAFNLFDTPVHQDFADAFLPLERGVRDRVTEPVRCNGLDDRGLARRLTKRERAEQPAGTPVSTRGSAAE